MSLETIKTLQVKLESDLKNLIEAFQLRPETKGIQVDHILISQQDWHNGYEKGADLNENLRSGAQWGYRLNSVKVKLVVP